MNRRSFLTHATAVSVGVSVPFIGRSVFAKETVVIGGPLSLSGVFASVGTPVDQGNRMAVEFFSKSLPVRLQYMSLDDQSDPGKGVRKVQEAIQQHGVKYFSGTSNSASAMAVAKEVYAAGGVYVNQAGADSMTGVDCNRSTFRWPAATYGAVEQSVRPLTAMYPKAKRWYTITGQYVFGQALLENTKRVLAETQCEHVGNVSHSLSEKEFSGYIANAMAAKPDVLCILNFGNQTMDVIRAAVNFGMKRNVIIIAPWSTGLDQFQALGADIVEGLYFGIQYWHDLKTPGNLQLLEAYSKLYKDKPNHSFATAFACTQVIAEGIRKANSTECSKVIQALEGLQYEGICGTETVRAGDHQILKDCYLARGKARSAMKDPYDFVDIVSSGQSFIPVEQTGCKLSA